MAKRKIGVLFCEYQFHFKLMSVRLDKISRSLSKRLRVASPERRRRLEIKIDKVDDLVKQTKLLAADTFRP